MNYNVADETIGEKIPRKTKGRSLKTASFEVIDFEKENGLGKRTITGTDCFHLNCLGEVNNGFVGDAHSVSGSRKSLNLHPVLLMPGNDADRFSEFSGRTAGGRSKSSMYRGAEYAPSIQNFQL